MSPLPEPSERAQGLRVTTHVRTGPDGGHVAATVRLFPAGLHCTTTNPDRLRYWARLLTNAADAIDTHRAQRDAGQQLALEVPT